MSLNLEFFGIPSTNNLYAINLNGDVIRVKLGQGTKGNILKSYCDTTGYQRLRICLNGKSELRYVHRLLAEVFIRNPDGKECVNHIDGDKSNNNINNLEWVTYSENTQHAIKIGLHKKGEECYNYKHGKYSKHKKELENV